MTDSTTRTGPLPTSPANAAAEGYAAHVEANGAPVTAAVVAEVAASFAALDDARAMFGIPARAAYAAAADWLAGARELIGSGEMNGMILMSHGASQLHAVVQAHGLDHPRAADVVYAVGWYGLGVAACDERVPGVVLTPWMLANPNSLPQVCIALDLAADVCRTALMETPGVAPALAGTTDEGDDRS